MGMHGDDCVCPAMSDMVRDTVAFIKARMDDDEQAAIVIIEGSQGGVLIGVTDMCIAMIRVVSEMTHVDPKAIVDTLYAGGVAMGAMFEQMENNG